MNTDVVAEVWAVIGDRLENPPEQSYVVDILTHRKGADKALEKVGEETTEFLLAAKNDDYTREVEEAADLIFHILLALKATGVDLADVLAELGARRK